MLHMYNKSAINPNEELRRQFVDIIDNYDDFDDVYDQIFDVIETLKEINYHQYIVTIQLIYKDVYSYFSYINKSNETNNDFKQSLYALSATSSNEVSKIYEDNTDLLLENFVYILRLNNMFKVRLLLELNEEQHKHLTKIAPFHLFDLLALKEYLGFEILEDYFLKNIDNESEDEEDSFEFIPEELVEDIINFLNYLYFSHKEIYTKIIKEVIEKIYKWSYYYFENSIEVAETDLEFRVLKLVDGFTLDEICENIKNNQKLLTEIILRIFDDIDMGYPSITTETGNILVTESEVDEYMAKVKRKHI